MAQSIKIGGNAANVVQISGNHNTVTAHLASGAGPEVLAALTGIQAALAANRSAHLLTGEAVKEAKSPKPDKVKIGDYLSSALDTAKRAIGLGETVAHLAPQVQTVADWLGGEGTRLLGG